MDRVAIAIHLGRLQYQLGRKLTVGSTRYRVKGYIPNRLTTDLHHEPHVYRTIKRVLAQKQGTFIDVGVNVGQTLLSVLSIDPSRPYVGFEPQIACAFFVDQFISDNGLSHVQVISMALSEADGLLPLYSNRICDDMASLQGNPQVDGQDRHMCRMVPVRKGDAAIADLGLDAIAAIKIDVEGAELQVLRGLMQTLAKYRPAVLFEVLPNFYGLERVMQPIDACARNNEAADGILDFFARAGYRIHQIDEHGNEHVIDRFDLDAAEKFVSADYIAHPVA